MSSDRDDAPIPTTGELLRHTGSLKDPDQEPERVICSCGAVLPWTWWDGRGRIPGRWCRPATDPCSKCESAVAADAEREAVRKRLEKAHLPNIHTSFTWERTLRQRPDDDLGEWMRHVKALSKDVPTIGVRACDEDAAQAISSWEPSHGWLYVCGPVGVGKSLMVAARLADLLRQSPGESRVELTLDQLLDRGFSERVAREMIGAGRNVLIRPAGHVSTARWMPWATPAKGYDADDQERARRKALERPVWWVHESDLVRQVIDGWSKDKDPLAQMADAPILVLDDLGVEGAAEEEGLWQKTALQSFRRLVNYRLEHHMPMLITSNVVPGLLRKVYGERTADRMLRANVRVVELEPVVDHQGRRGRKVGGEFRPYSWAHAPPMAPSRRHDRDQVPDRKSVAADQGQMQWTT